MGFKDSRRQRKEMTICGGLLLAVLLIVLCFLVFKLVPWHILSIILCVIAALIVVFVLIGAFLPFNIDKIILQHDYLCRFCTICLKCWQIL